MATNIDLPAVRGTTTDAKVSEILDYMYSLVEKLNYEFNNISGVNVSVASGDGSASGSSTSDIREQVAGDYDTLNAKINNVSSILQGNIDTINNTLGDIGSILDEINGETI